MNKLLKFMSVESLIEALNKIEDKKLPIIYTEQDDTDSVIVSITDNGNCVIMKGESICLH